MKTRFFLNHCPSELVENWNYHRIKKPQSRDKTNIVYRSWNLAKNFFFDSLIPCKLLQKIGELQEMFAWNTSSNSKTFDPETLPWPFPHRSRLKIKKRILWHFLAFYLIKLGKCYGNGILRLAKMPSRR